MKYTNQLFCTEELILSLLTNVVIFLVNPHKFIPTLSAMSITIDEHGNFKEVTLLAKGYNIFTLIAKDRLKRQKEYRLELVNTLK